MAVRKETRLVPSPPPSYSSLYLLRIWHGVAALPLEWQGVSPTNEWFGKRGEEEGVCVHGV